MGWPHASTVGERPPSITRGGLAPSNPSTRCGLWAATRVLRVAVAWSPRRSRQGRASRLGSSLWGNLAPWHQGPGASPRRVPRGGSARRTPSCWCPSCGRLVPWPLVGFLPPPFCCSVVAATTTNLQHSLRCSLQSPAHCGCTPVPLPIQGLPTGRERQRGGKAQATCLSWP